MLKEQTASLSNNANQSSNLKLKPAQIALAFGVAGLGIIGWLVIWQLFFGAAQWYGLALALTTSLLFLIQSYVKLKIAKITLGFAASVLAGLAIITSLSLGVFLPFGVADIISPALGRFGGLGALTVLAVVFTMRAILTKKSRLLDLALFCIIAASWVGVNTSAQAQFPPAPTTKEDWGAILGLLPGLGLVCFILALFTSYIKSWKWAARTFWRWTVGSTILGGALSTYFQQSFISLICWILLAVTGAIGLGYGFKAIKWLSWRPFIQIGAVLLIVISLFTLYLSTAEQLETVLARNTLERYAQKGWWWLLGEDRFPEQRGLKVEAKPTGTITGRVADENNSDIGIDGVEVIIADPSGKTYTATTLFGNYTIKDVPAGNYLPMAARAGYLDASATGEITPFGRWSGTISRYRLVASVRGGGTTDNINFVMKKRGVYQIQPGNSLKLGEASETFRDNPVPSPALRRTFSFENSGLSKSGLLYEPSADKGPGPFPILIIVYPGPATSPSWEGVSIPLAAQGFVVVAYQPELFGPNPERGLNLKGDVSDMLQLYNYAKSGQFSLRGDPQKVVITGGSVSTVYTYLLLRELENSTATDKAAIKGGIMYGGLADMYRYRYDWDRGKLYIDPGIQDLESMLIAFGRPDLRPEIYMQFSPYFHLDKNSLPPLLLVHTSKDSIVPVVQTELLAGIMDRLNIQKKLLIYQDIEHYLDTSKRDPAQLDMLNQTIEFLKQVTR